MSIMNISKTPGSTTCQIQWNSSPAAANEASAYLSTNQADFNNLPTMPGTVIVVPSDQYQNGLLPSTALTATATGLQQGTTYYLLCEADGVYSSNNPPDSFATTGAVPGPQPTVHLIPKGDADNDGPDWDVKTGKSVEVKARVVKIGDPKTRVPGVTVNFSISGGTGSVTLQQASAVSNDRGIAKVAVTGVTVGDVSILIAAQSADNHVTTTVHVHA